MATISARIRIESTMWRRNFSDLITCRTRKKRPAGRQINERKAMIGETLKTALESSKYFFVLQYSDLCSQEWNNIRYTLREHEINVKVFPTKLSNKVLEQTKFQGLGNLFKSSVVTCYSDKDNVKEFVQTVKGVPKLELLGGILDNKLLSKTQIIKHSILPPLSVLRMELIGYLEEPKYQFIDVIDLAQRNLVSSLDLFVKSESQD